MRSFCPTYCQSWVIGLLPAKINIYRYFLLISVIFTSGRTIAIQYPAYFYVLNTLQHSPCLNSDSFLCIHAFKVHIHVWCVHGSKVEVTGTVRIYRYKCAQIKTFTWNCPYYESFSACNTKIYFILDWVSVERLLLSIHSKIMLIYVLLPHTYIIPRNNLKKKKKNNGPLQREIFE